MRLVAFVVIVVVGFVLLTNGELLGQNELEKRIGTKQDELSDIKRKIDEHRSKANQLKKNEQSLLSKIKTLDKEIDLQRQFLRNLREQESMMALHIDSLQTDIAFEESTLTVQAHALSRRLRQMYKRDPNHRWEILLGSSSIQQAVNRYKFMKIIAERDAATITGYRDDKRLLETESAALTETLGDLTMVRLAQEREGLELEKGKRERESMLKKVRGEKSQHTSAIAQLEKAQKEVKDLLGRLEEKRLDNRTVVGDGEFVKLKGQMIWPVEGKVLRKFGKITHPKYATVTFNNGIDIGAPAGSPIRAVAAGTVEFVDWIDAYGKCVILNHGDGYYTLYAHVSATYVTLGQSIAHGAVIAEVGDTGSLDGFECHFEIRKSKSAVNPLEWLTPRRASS